MMERIGIQLMMVIGFASIIHSPSPNHHFHGGGSMIPISYSVLVKSTFQCSGVSMKYPCGTCGGRTA